MNDENEIEMIESGKCSYFNPINEDETCSPLSHNCMSGVDENGEVYCDRLKRRYYEIIYDSEVSE